MSLSMCISEPGIIGRPVRAVSVAFRPGIPLNRIADLVEAEASLGSDLILLPELCRGQIKTTSEMLDGETVTTIAGIARAYRTYIVCPIDRWDGECRRNSAVVLDRAGEVACVYDKVHPFGHEFEIDPPVEPGCSIQVFQADFGSVGLAICFDVNWPHLWRQLAEQGAELVVWPSAYSAGRALQAHAITYHYPIVSSTWIPDSRIFDIDGSEIVCDRANRGEDVNVTRSILDLDRCLFHLDYNYPTKLDALLRDHFEDVEMEKLLEPEAWFILRAKRSGVSARQLARQYGLQELREYIRDARVNIESRRRGAYAGA